MLSKRLVLLILLFLLVMLISGCEKKILVRQSLTPVPQEVNGALYVATNKRIPVGVEGTKEVLEIDVGGYYLIHKNDLAAILRKLKECSERPE